MAEKAIRLGGESTADAIVSAVSKAVTEQEVLSVVFVLEWGGE